MNSPGYFAIIPASVRYDKRLKPNAKLLYAEITSLCNMEGYCWADNLYFSELYNVANETISRWISQLVSYGYLDVKISKSEGNKRVITIDRKVNTYCQKDQEVLTKRSRGIDKKINSLYENNKNNNKTNNTIEKKVCAIEYFSKNYPSIFNEFEMKYRNRIPDFELFKDALNAKLENEGFVFGNKLPNRVIVFTSSYVLNNQKKTFVNTEIEKRNYSKKLS